MSHARMDEPYTCVWRGWIGVGCVGQPAHESVELAHRIDHRAQIGTNCTNSSPPPPDPSRFRVYMSRKLAGESAAGQRRRWRCPAGWSRSARSGEKGWGGGGSESESESERERAPDSTRPDRSKQPHNHNGDHSFRIQNPTSRTRCLPPSPRPAQPGTRPHPTHEAKRKRVEMGGSTT